MQEGDLDIQWTELALAIVKYIYDSRCGIGSEKGNPQIILDLSLILHNNKRFGISNIYSVQACRNHEIRIWLYERNKNLITQPQDTIKTEYGVLAHRLELHISTI